MTLKFLVMKGCEVDFGNIAKLEGAWIQNYIFWGKLAISSTFSSLISDKPFKFAMKIFKSRFKIFINKLRYHG